MSRRGVAVTLLFVVGMAVVVIATYRQTRPTRETVRTFVSLIEAANSGNLSSVRGLCSSGYLRSHKLKLADEGGVVGLPRNINKNFQVWSEGGTTFLCPTNRVGPVYRFVVENGEWKFDGPIGILNAQGRVETLSVSE